MAIDPETLYLQLSHLVASMPDLKSAWNTPESHLWLGKAGALVRAAGDVVDNAAFTVASDSLGGALHARNLQTITSVVYRTLAVAELSAPAALRGQFIAAGDSLTAFGAVSSVFARANNDLMLIDVYADQTIITDFAVTAPAGVELRILAGNKESRNAVLKPAIERWHRQFDSRPLQVRVAPVGTLHDRLILVDNKEAWIVGQSFNAIAARAHTSIMRADPDLSAQKVVAYNLIWASALPLEN